MERLGLWNTSQGAAFASHTGTPAISLDGLPHYYSKYQEVPPSYMRMKRNPDPAYAEAPRLPPPPHLFGCALRTRPLPLVGSRKAVDSLRHLQENLGTKREAGFSIAPARVNIGPLVQNCTTKIQVSGWGYFHRHCIYCESLRSRNFPQFSKPVLP